MYVLTYRIEISPRKLVGFETYEFKDWTVKD